MFVIMAHSHYDPAALLANVKFLSDSLILKVLLIVLVIVLLYLLRKAINDGKKVWLMGLFIYGSIKCKGKNLLMKL